MYIIGNSDFVKNVDEWLFRNEQKYAQWLKSHSSGIPDMFKKFDGFLYRGMMVDGSFIDTLLKDGITFKNHTSWTKDKSVAVKFADDPKYRIADTNKNLIKVMLKKKISQSHIILDIYGYVSFMGVPQLEMLGMDEMSIDSAMNEKEVLVSSGIKITKKDIDPNV